MAVNAPGSNMMMRSQKTEGSADSGCGVTLAGFYAPNGDVQEKLKVADHMHGAFSEIALHESEGWTTFVGVSQGAPPAIARYRVSSLRRESHKFFEELPVWFFRTKASYVRRLCISQASGFISLTLLYCDDEKSV